jgi:hypothetical protein
MLNPLKHLINGAPEEIRTPDPQIRSLAQSTEILEYFCKPLLIGAPTYQWLMLDLQTDQGSNCGSCTLKIDLGKTAREPATSGSFAPEAVGRCE